MMEESFSRNQQESPSVDPTRGGSGRADGSLASEPVDDPVTLDNIQEYLDGIQFPTSGEAVIAYARQRHAPLAVLDRLEWVATKGFNSASELEGALHQVEQTLNRGTQ